MSWETWEMERDLSAEAYMNMARAAPLVIEEDEWDE